VKAIILAAGRGERLRPLTDTTPKALLEVGGKALIQRHIEALARHGYRDLVINLGHLGENIRARLGDGHSFGVKIRYSVEPPGALETGGGLLHALRLLGEDPFLAINADIVTDFPLARLAGTTPEYARWILVDNPPHNPEGDFSIVDGRLKRAISASACYTFSGIAVYNPRLFNGLQAGRFPITPIIECLAASGKIEAEHYRGLWMDVGTPQRLARAQRAGV